MSTLQVSFVTAALVAFAASPTHADEPAPPTGGSAVTVPTVATAVTLDGEVGDDEWGDAASRPTGAAKVRAQLHDGDLYVALDAPPPVVGHVCLTRGDRVAVLHASAALGTAVYERKATSDEEGEGEGERAGDWARVQEFSWCCRDQDEGELAAQLEAEGWIGTVQRQGNRGQIELRIDPDHALFAGPGPLRLAAATLNFDTGTLYLSPTDLADGCADLDLVRGTAGDARAFDPEGWWVVDAER